MEKNSAPLDQHRHQHQHQQRHPGTMTQRRRALRRGHSLVAVALLVVMTLLYLTTFHRSVSIHVTTTTSDLSSSDHLHHHQQQQNLDVVSPAEHRVPLEAHIISKCPDTRDALRELILPVMQRVSDEVDFTLSYIGKTTSHDGVDCLHGPPECLGNIIELCALELYPDPKIYLGFVMCLTRDYTSIPDRSLIEDCALEHAVDFDAINECATKDDGAHGIDLLRASVRRTAEANVTKSCTVRLDNEIYCIRDGGEWSDCPHGSGVNDLIIAIEKLYHS
ncbi:Gamma interferon inducible lysosomal thiol reductase (GILT) [Geosmithia morbida]|uniref:Gamma interferon inducible lysosomal thiol reductase (GILT) n=1 Tax=Geosmithia morbida TaxID=1094350 RepID=A0A9P5D8H7_9HYPO|nr:Gamma interferon inducible lysosomal thiol reductase (GILT) [Geosmithia morbida]KAF4126800.1 Gamma interferon inducible lysosomal thiol reductase (GILT) [Geosmithia morbida]